MRVSLGRQPRLTLEGTACCERYCNERANGAVSADHESFISRSRVGGVSFRNEKRPREGAAAPFECRSARFLHTSVFPHGVPCKEEGRRAARQGGRSAAVFGKAFRGIQRSPGGRTRNAAACESPAARNGKGRPSQAAAAFAVDVNHRKLIPRHFARVKRFFDESAIIQINKLGQNRNKTMNWDNTHVHEIITRKRRPAHSDFIAARRLISLIVTKMVAIKIALGRMGCVT